MGPRLGEQDIQVITDIILDRTGKQINFSDPETIKYMSDLWDFNRQSRKKLQEAVAMEILKDSGYLEPPSQGGLQDGMPLKSYDSGPGPSSAPDSAPSSAPVSVVPGSHWPQGLNIADRLKYLRGKK